jgi:hypothetical protein
VAEVAQTPLLLLLLTLLWWWSMLPGALRPLEAAREEKKWTMVQSDGPSCTAELAKGSPSAVTGRWMMSTLWASLWDLGLA